VSGAVFLLPVQLSVLGVPSPAVTPTNLLFNIVAGLGALLRYRKRGLLGGPLTRRLVLGTLPGVVIGAVIRVFAVPGQPGGRRRRQYRDVKASTTSRAALLFTIFTL
jgi:uncharacterized protein